MNKGAPVNYLKDLDIAQTKNDLIQLQGELKKATAEPDYNGEVDLMLAVIENLQETLSTLKDTNGLDLKKQARIFSDLSMVSSIASLDDEEYDDDEELEFEEEEEEETDNK